MLNFGLNQWSKAEQLWHHFMLRSVGNETRPGGDTGRAIPIGVARTGQCADSEPSGSVLLSGQGPCGFMLPAFPTCVLQARRTRTLVWAQQLALKMP